MKKHYLHENKKIIKLIILISTMISAFSLYLDFFVLHNSLLLTLGDCALFVILLAVHLNYEMFLTNEKLRQFVVAMLPLVYFPLAWLGSTGNSQIGGALLLPVFLGDDFHQSHQSRLHVDTAAPGGNDAPSGWRQLVV